MPKEKPTEMSISSRQIVEILSKVQGSCSVNDGMLWLEDGSSIDLEKLTRQFNIREELTERLRNSRDCDELCDEAADAIDVQAAAIERMGADYATLMTDFAALEAKLNALQSQKPIYAFRRKGLEDFCTCTEERYFELAGKPNLFEVAEFYTTPKAMPNKQMPVMFVDDSGAFHSRVSSEQVEAVLGPVVDEIRKNLEFQLPKQRG